MAVSSTPFSSPTRWSRTVAHTAFACAASLLLHAVALGGLAWLYRSSAAQAVAGLDVRIASVYLAPAAAAAVEPVPPPGITAPPLSEDLPSPPNDLSVDAPRPSSIATVLQPASLAPALASPATMASAPIAPPPSTTTLAPERPAPVRRGGSGPRPSSAVAIEWRVQDWLAQHRHYPRAARRSGAEGTVWVRFVLDRGGSLHGSEILESSGHAVLDRAALDLLQRAAPFPALPSDLAMDEIELVLPIEYDLTRAARG